MIGIMDESWNIIMMEEELRRMQKIYQEAEMNSRSHLQKSI